MKLASAIALLVLAMPLSSQTLRYMAPAGSSPAGNDSNSGVDAAHPWLSPNHTITAPTVILAIAGAYDSANFYNQKWGACASTGDICWVECATTFGCTITSSTEHAMFISASYWGTQGFVLNTTGSGGGCVVIAPSYGSETQIDHIVVANTICNGAIGDGFDTNNSYGITPATGVDYVAYLGNIAYATGGSSTTCAAGLSFYSLVASDTNPGTHVYMAGNFGWGNTSNCGDGEGIIFDTFDGVEDWPTPQPYTPQAVAENNIMVWNNGPGVQVDLNQNGSGPWAPVYFLHNTVAYNAQGPSTASYCAEIVLGTTVTAYSTTNLVVAPTQYCFGGGSVVHYGTAPVFAATVTNKVYNEFAYSAFGTGVGSVSSTGFVAGPNNITSTNPTLSNPVQPGAPSCSGQPTTTACMAGLIANYAPTNAAAKDYGYQQPSTTSVYNPYYPQWLCSVTNIPTGLHTPGCTAAEHWQ